MTSEQKSESPTAAFRNAMQQQNEYSSPSTKHAVSTNELNQQLMQSADIQRNQLKPTATKVGMGYTKEEKSSTITPIIRDEFFNKLATTVNLLNSVNKGLSFGIEGGQESEPLSFVIKGANRSITGNKSEDTRGAIANKIAAMLAYHLGPNNQGERKTPEEYFDVKTLYVDDPARRKERCPVVNLGRSGEAELTLKQIENGAAA
jgi:hypothetical protein